MKNSVIKGNNSIKNWSDQISLAICEILYGNKKRCKVLRNVKCLKSFPYKPFDDIF